MERPASLTAVRAARLPGRRSVTTLAQVGIVAAFATLYALVLREGWHGHQDLVTYLAAGRDLVQGRPLYDAFLHHPFPDATLRPAYIYPPVFSLLMSPLSLLPAPVAVAAWYAGMQAALLGALWIGLRALRADRWGAVLSLAATCSFLPLWIDVAQGQANLLILLLVTAGMVAIAAGRPAGALAIGVAAAVKLTPLLLLGWLLWERRFREAAWLAAGFLVTTTLGVLVRPADSLAFFTRVLPALAGGTAFYSNQSIGGGLARLFSRNAYTSPWAVLPWLGVIVLIASLAALGWWAVRSRHDPDSLTRGLLFLPAVPLVSAVTWEHHLVILLPVFWSALVAAARRGWPLPRVAVLGGLLAAASVLPRWHPGPSFPSPSFRAAQTADPLVMLTSNALLLTTIALFLLAPWLLRSR